MCGRAPRGLLLVVCILHQTLACARRLCGYTTHHLAGKILQSSYSLSLLRTKINPSSSSLLFSSINMRAFPFVIHQQTHPCLASSPSSPALHYFAKTVAMAAPELFGIRPASFFLLIAFLAFSPAGSYGDYAWQSGHATFYGGGDATGTMGKLLSLHLSGKRFLLKILQLEEV